jgi:hypothetical protein
MKELINKTQKKIYAIFQTLKSNASKLRISSFVGGQFKKRQKRNESLILFERMQRNWQNYILSLMFGGGVFIIPIISDHWYNGFVTEKTLTLSLAMYIISISTMTKEIVIFGLSFITTIMLLIHYGTLKDENIINLYSPVMFVFYSVLLLYSIERFFRHIIDKEEYWDFFKFKK